MIIVTGLPRSGTSLCMQMLAAGGVPVLIDHPDCPDADGDIKNPRGYWEYQKATWRNGLDAAQGKAVKVIGLGLIPRVDAKYLVMRRDELEIASSQETTVEVVQTDLADLLEQLAGRDCLEVWHRDLFEEPAAAIAKINDFLGGGLDVAAMARAIDPSLYRHRGGIYLETKEIPTKSKIQQTITFNINKPLTPDWQPVLSTTGGLSVSVDCQGPTGWSERLRVEGSAGSFHPNYQPTDRLTRLRVRGNGKTDANISLG